MTLHATKVLAMMALAAGGLSLAGCMQDGAQRASAPTPQTTTPAFALYYMDEGASAKLAYGQANSDNVALMLQCAKGSRMVEVTDAMSSAETPALTLVSALSWAGSNTVARAAGPVNILQYVVWASLFSVPPLVLP